MSCSSSKSMNQDMRTLTAQNPNLEWMEDFLSKMFFHPCLSHQIRKNEKNIYCLNCDEAICQYCVTTENHRHHKMLKIYRHVYKDVVSLNAMEKYIDCSEIQPYKCNRRLVISLNPLPHSGPISSNEASCDICNRRIAEPEAYRYCSISCKVKAMERSSRPAAPICSPVREREEAMAPPTKSRHRRKGIPRRAPFF